MKSTWSDEEFEGIQEEDELVSNQVAFFGTLVSDNCVFMQGREGVATEYVCLSAKLGSIALETNQQPKVTVVQNLIVEMSLKKTMSLEVYEMMYAQWLKV